MIAAKTREDEAGDRFEHDTAEHVMTVLHDDGLYRHLRFQKPGTSSYWYDLITWPGCLVISGDMGSYHFSRLRDMFEFFGGYAHGINAHYWGEKLKGPRPGRDGAKSYSENAFRARVLEWFEQVSEDMPEERAESLRTALDEEVLRNEDGYLGDESEARSRIHDFEHDGLTMVDAWEWNFREYDFAYLWCCWAIVKGIEQYRAMS